MEKNKVIEIQNLIFSGLELQGRTNRSLAKEIGCAERLLSRWKTHDNGMSIDYADKALKALGLSFVLGQAPTIDPVRHGRWINESEEDECHNVECECSLCHHKDIHAVSAIVPYCWHCGAKMDGGSDDEQQG